MISVRRWPIRMRVLLVGTVPVLVAALLITSYHMFKRWEEMQRETRVLTEIALENLAASAEYPLFSGNYAMLDPVVSSVLKQPSIASVEIRNLDGERVFYRQIDRYAEIPLTDMRFVEQPITQEIPAFDAFNDLGDGEVLREPIGRVRLEITDTFNLQRQDAILIQSLMTGIGVILVSMMVAGAISTTMIPPLEKLTSFIRLLANGKTDGSIDVDNGAEIGELQLSANRLAESLESARQNQARYTAQLHSEKLKTEQALRAKSEFLSMISHEVRTPLNGISGALQLIRQDISEPEFDEYRSMAEKSLAGLSQILEDILIVVDTDKVNMPIAYEAHCLTQELGQLMEEFRHKALEKELSFVVDFDPQLCQQSLLMEPSLIRQALRHLIDNAVKFTDDGYVLIKFSLSPQLDHHWLVVDIIDSGIGIPADQRHKVTQAFAQVSSSFNRQYDGMGLGLTISHHICHVLGGGIQLNDNHGQGTHVVVNLPLKLAEEKETEHSSQASEQRGRILVVEDNQVNLKVAQKMLNRVCPDADITIAESGERCLQLIEAQTFDLILMDCQMPGLDGFETTEALRQRGITCPIVACTANSSDEVRQRCLAVGMNDFISKPVSLAQMQKMVSRWNTCGEQEIVS